MDDVIRIESVSKRYQLGLINRRTLYEDLQSRVARWRGKEDPNATIDRHGKVVSNGTLWALKDVSFSLQQGDVLGVIGQNGSGKSTLLKILSQITAPTSGRILIKGRVASLLEVGTGFHPELTGRDNVFLNGVILGMSHADVARKFDEIVAFSGVEGFIDTPVKRYSSGMRMRLAFAVAANLDPEILVIDEVLAVGDQAFQQKCLGKISEVAHAGRTVLFVSHNAAAVENLCNRGIVLDHGQLVFSGKQDEAIRYYADSQDRSHHASLSERTDRTGNGDVRITGIQLRGENGEPQATAFAGQTLEVHLHFDNPSGKPLPNLVATLFVRTHLDAPVFVQQNRLTGDDFGDLPKSGALVCRIPRLPLPASTYRIGFTLVSNPQRDQILDSIHHAIDLPVETGDFFGTGKLPSQISGVALVDAKWRLEPAEELIQTGP